MLKGSNNGLAVEAENFGTKVSQAPPAMGAAVVFRLMFERSFWTLARAAMILFVVRNPILERRQRL